MQDNKIAEFIKKLRKENNLTQNDLANKYNVTFQAVSKWENGKSIPDISILKKISEEFNINIDELLGSETLIYVTMAAQPLVAKVNARVDVKMHDEIELAFDMNKCHFFDINTELRIVR